MSLSCLPPRPHCFCCLDGQQTNLAKWAFVFLYASRITVSYDQWNDPVDDQTHSTTVVVIRATVDNLNLLRTVAIANSS